MSGYPPIPRDPSGAPLPVVWDDGLQSWKVYEGLMPLETKLAAIESKLLALDSKFADGSAKVALSGTVDEVIKELSGIHQTPSGWRAYGENISSGSNMVKPLDVSGYTDIVVRVRNNTQVQIGTVGNALRFYTRASVDTGIIGNELSDVQFRVKEVPTIPAGAIAYYTSREHPELGEFCIGLTYAFWMETTPTDGTVEVSFFGRRR